MSGLQPMLSAQGLVAPNSGNEAETAAGELAAICNLPVYARSIVAKDRAVYFMAHRGLEKLLCVLSSEERPQFAGQSVPTNLGILKLCRRDAENMRGLAALLPYLNPQCIGLSRSLGMGDRLGIATPGHIRAIRGTQVKAVLAQQSIREMARTCRTPAAVLEDAQWGVFEEGYREGFGADADHLKTISDLDATASVGFRMFTIDPGEFVDNVSESDNFSALQAKLEAIPWKDLETTEKESKAAFTGKPRRVGYDMELTFSEETLARAIVKYARAVAHTAKLFRHLRSKMGEESFELEMSVDETDLPTSPHEHFYIAHELKRMGVEIASLAPRFVGDFEKGIDYKGDISQFETTFAQHVKIARHFGPYKISIHSGSDKFSIYAIAAKHARELIHVKTAGTSYLEALRAIAEVAPALFREILEFGLKRYEQDKISYHVSANPAKIAKPTEVPDNKLAALLDSNDARQVLHVTYGSALTATSADGEPIFRNRILDALRLHEDVHYDTVARHMKRHVDPLVAAR